jgi:hypothetical protein
MRRRSRECRERNFLYYIGKQKILSSEIFQAGSNRHFAKTVCGQGGALGTEISKLEEMGCLNKE